MKLRMLWRIDRRIVAGSVLFALLAAAGSATFHFLHDDAADGSVAAAADATAKDADGTAAVPLDAPDPEAIVAHAERAATAGADAPRASLEEELAAANRELDEGPEDGVPVQVVDGADDVAVAGAIVAAIDYRRVQADELPQLQDDLALLDARGAQLFRANDDGLVHVPRPSQWCYVLAQYEGRRGCARASATSFETVTVALHAPADLVVRVVDEKAAPQIGVTIAVGDRGASLCDSDLTAVTTAPDGIARLRDLDLLLTTDWRGRELVAGFAFPLGHAADAVIRLDPPPTEPLTLVLPPTGSLLLRVVDAAGKPLALDGTVTLSMQRSDAPDGNNADARGFKENLAVSLAADGTAVVPRVGLGLHVRARARLREHDAGQLTIDGPVEAGEQVAIDLPAGRLGPLVVGRALTQEGQPLAQMTLETRLDLFRGDGRRVGQEDARATTDEAGRFRLDFSHADPERRERTFILQLSLPESDTSPPRVAKADVALPDEGIVDLGDVALAEAPQLAHGLAVDELERPVEGAIVRVLLKQTEGTPPPRFWAGRDPTTTSDEQGRFALFGELRPGTASLVASRAGYLPSLPVPIAMGDEVKLVLRIGGTVLGSLALDDRLPRAALSVRLLPNESGPREPRAPRIGENGLFRWDLLTPGLYRFRLLLGRDPDKGELLTEVRDVEVRPGETTRDDRMQAIDVGALVRFVALEVRMPDGGPADEGAVVRAPAKEEKRDPERDRGVPIRDGRVWYPTTLPRIDLAVAVPGYRCVRIDDARGQVTVTLERGYPVRLVLNERHPKRPDFEPLKVQAFPAAPELRRLPITAARTFDGRRDVLLWLPAPGKYSASVTFTARREPGADPSRARDGDTADARADFEIADVAGEQVIELHLKGR